MAKQINVFQNKQLYLAAIIGPPKTKPEVENVRIRVKTEKGFEEGLVTLGGLIKTVDPLFVQKKPLGIMEGKAVLIINRNKEKSFLNNKLIRVNEKLLDASREYGVIWVVLYAKDTRKTYIIHTLNMNLGKVRGRDELTYKAQVEECKIIKRSDPMITIAKKSDFQTKTIR